MTYAQLGPNDDEGAAAFLQPGFKLACPDFAQYEFSAKSYLNDAFDCLEQRRPNLVLVTPLFQLLPSYDTDWNVFVRTATGFLHRQYVETGVRQGYVVWRRRA